MVRSQKFDIITSFLPETVRLAEDVTEPATFVATQVYTPLSSSDTPTIRRVASSVSLYQHGRKERCGHCYGFFI